MNCPDCEEELEKGDVVLGCEVLYQVLFCTKCDYEIPESEIGEDLCHGEEE
jgi:hypothetical protein